jgi:hypothetical protein
MDNFKLIYRVLRFLEAASRQEEFDDDSFSAEHYKVNESLWANTLEMLVDRDYIKGVTVKRGADGHVSLSISSPRITLTGLEYLQGNDFMRKAAAEAKGIN